MCNIPQHLSAWYSIPGIPTTIKTVDVNIATIAYLRVLIIKYWVNHYFNGGGSPGVLLGWFVKKNTPKFQRQAVSFREGIWLQTSPTDFMEHTPKIQIWKELLHEQIVKGLGHVPGMWYIIISHIQKISTLSKHAQNVGSGRQKPYCNPKIQL